MAKILALDTSMTACSAAIQIDTTIIERYELAPQKQSELILPMIDALLAETNLKLNDLDAIAFGRGPGSFTGARLAASLVQGLSFAADLPVISISTLNAIAQRTYREHGETHVLVALDAHLEEVYWAAYTLDNFNLMQPMLNDTLCTPKKLLFPADIINYVWSVAGDAWQIYETIFKEQCSSNRVKVTNIHLKQCSHAHDIVQLASNEYQHGRIIKNKTALPVYLQNDVYKRSK